MQKLAKGVHKFQQEAFGAHQELFTKLAEKQSPHTLFITCSDSRISPNLMTQTAPGEIFILRNAGNIIPTYGGHVGGEAATIEFAVAGLGLEHIVVCGHSNCGAMKALLAPDTLKDLPAMKSWLGNAEVTRRIVTENYPDRTGDDLLNVVTQENVLAQLESLRTHPAVASRVARGQLHLHGWVYKIPTGEVYAYDPVEGQFRPLADAAVAETRARYFGNPDAMGT
jgi:carbonic anhydrase